MKRLTAILLVCAFLLVGCGDPKTDPSASAPDTPPVTQRLEQSEALEAFRESCSGGDFTLAAAFLGYAELPGYEDLTVYLEANGFYDRYPFLSDLTREQFLQQEGGELYLIVPASEDIALTVCECHMDETDYEMDPGDELLKLEAGQPVVLQGNISDIVPNLWVVAEKTGAEPFSYTPYLSLMDGSLATADGVYDATDYDLLAALWGGVEVPVFCGTWYARAEDSEEQTFALKLTLWEDGFVEYAYGIPESEVLERFEGYWSENDGILSMDLHGGLVEYDDLAYDKSCAFQWDYQSRQLTLKHTEGGTILYGTEGESFVFLPFDSHRLAGNWSAGAMFRDWIYDLVLLDNGECRFAISENGTELVSYEGWWTASEDGCVSLSLGQTAGQHPESPTLDYINGTYLVEKNGRSMVLHYVSGEILTLNMEEDGFETFAMNPEGSCVSVHYAEDVAVDWSVGDWVIVDDTDPAVEAAFCTMVPVEDFIVIALFQDGFRNDGMPNFGVRELYEYGTLAPECPLKVALTIPGTMPAYGISFTDPDGTPRIFGVTISGEDGSLELMEID